QFIPCNERQENCAAWEPASVWIDSGLGTRVFLICDLPAAAATGMMVRVLGRFNVSQLTTFLISMPVLTFAWFHFIGWLIDRWTNKRLTRTLSISSHS